ncbi:hypothetical protein SAMN02910456_00476 [Ruminococcaceae bacterium YRB3002]|nr:hypothetical protein SAMN02910456_00476 [Ruminococcaceae bacterium YRB3002]
MDRFKSWFVIRRVVVSIIISVLYSLGMYSWNYGFESSYAILLIGTIRFFLSFVVTQLFISFVHRVSEMIFDDGECIWNNRKLIRNIAVFLLCWFPFLITRYPSAISVDCWWGISEYYSDAITGIQPIGYIALTIVLIKLFGPNLGMFVLSFLGYLLYSYSFGYAVTFLDAVNVKKRVRIVIMLLCITSPFILGYIGVAIKDTLFSVGIMMLILMLIKVSRGISVTLCDSANYALFAFIAAFFRPNGVYILVVLSVLYIFSIIRYHIPIKPVVLIVVSTLSAVLVSSLLSTVFSVKPSSVNYREMLSVPFQQTARYVRYYDDDVTEEEREIIDELLVYNSLGARYNERISDPVKLLYTGKTEFLDDYLVVWWHQFLRHPQCYFEAFWAQNHYLFDPIASIKNDSFVEDVKEYYELSSKYSVEGWLGEETYFHDFISPDFLYPFRHFVVSFCISAMMLPIVWFNSNVALSCYITIICMLMMVGDKRINKSQLYYVAILMIMVSAMVGPAIQGHPRYLFPVMYTVPFVLINYMREIKEMRIIGG